MRHIRAGDHGNMRFPAGMLDSHSLDGKGVGPQSLARRKNISEGSKVPSTSAAETCFGTVSCKSDGAVAGARNDTQIIRPCLTHYFLYPASLSSYHSVGAVGSSRTNRSRGFGGG